MARTLVRRLFWRESLRRAVGLVPQLAAAEAYELWAETYPPVPHNALMRAEQSAMAPIVAKTSAARALDVGTGTGRYLPVIAAAGARTIVGVDLSLAMLARQDGARPRVCADARQLPFADGGFDLITSSLMLGDVDDLDAWVGEMARLLVPGGHLVYSDFHPSFATERWRRTFATRDGRQFRIPYHPHRLGAHLDALDAHGLDIRVIREPRVQDADATGLSEPQRHRPLVVVVHASKRPWRMPPASPR